MNWKNIKSFLIILFLIINLYLIFSTNGFTLKKESKSYVNLSALDDTVDIVKKNYGLSIEQNIVPKSFDKLSIIDVTNIIYTDKFKDSKYEFDIKGSVFKTTIKTNTYSYNETNAKGQMLSILKDIGIEPESYRLEFKKDDEGIVCRAWEVIQEYPIFNSEIRAVFSPSEIKLSGRWHLTQTKEEKSKNENTQMADISGIIIDMCSQITKSDARGLSLKKIDYGYYVSHYDENKVSKSASAIPCYMLKVDGGLKYYYDALDGKLLNKEE